MNFKKPSAPAFMEIVPALMKTLLRKQSFGPGLMGTLLLSLTMIPALVKMILIKPKTVSILMAMVPCLHKMVLRLSKMIVREHSSKNISNLMIPGLTQNGVIPSEARNLLCAKHTRFLPLVEMTILTKLLSDGIRTPYSRRQSERKSWIQSIIQ
ncbi:MAG: hypothetical protein HY063_12210 [Bacteroidetes bacterium]|nr:hypothetical protein [Bacteroidota bacterium]